MASYGDFAYYYDMLTENVDYDKRCEYICGLLAENGISEGILLDLACGTGTMSLMFSQKGYDVVGVDGSEEMLTQAQEKKMESGDDVIFLCQRMEELDLFGTINAAVSTLDSINHVTDEDTVKEIFRRVSLFMEDKGIFVFDVNTPYKHREVLGDNTFIESKSNLGNAIVGERSLIDKASVVEHSIIFDRTYLAGKLEIKNKIVTPGRIIDPYTGGVLERNSFSYAFSPIQNRSAWILRLWEHIIALVLALVFLIPYLLILPYYLTHKNSHWCWKLSMDRYTGFWAVLFFQKELVKSHPANDSFVFQMGEIYGLQNTPEQRRIYDYYYHYHCSCFLVLKVVLRSLGKRGFATYVERKRS